MTMSYDMVFRYKQTQIGKFKPEGQIYHGSIIFQYFWTFLCLKLHKIVHKSNSRQLIICALYMTDMIIFFQGKWQGSSFLKGETEMNAILLLVLFILIGIFSGVH